MTRLKQTRTLAAAVVLAATLGACTTTGGNGVSTSSATPSHTPTMTKTTTSATPTQSPEDLAIAAAKARIPEYNAMADSSLKDTKAFSIESFKKVAIGTALDDLNNRFSAVSAQGYTQTGDSVIESMTNPRVDLKLDLKKSPPDVPTVQLDVCLDVSKVNLIDAAGKSVLPADRKPRQWWRVGVSHYDYPNPPRWLVSFTDTQGGKTC